MARVEIRDVGPNKVKIIKIVRDTTGLGLKETKELVDSVPAFIDVPNNLINNFMDEMLDEGAVVVSNYGEECDYANIVNEEVKEGDSTENRLAYAESEQVREENSTGLWNANQVHNMNRDDTMRILIDVGKIAKESEELDAKLSELTKKRMELKKQAEMIREELSGMAKVIIWSVTIIAFVMGLFGGLLCILTGVIALIIMYSTVGKADLKKHQFENDAKADEFLRMNVDPIKEQIDDVARKRNELVNSGKISWAKDIVGEDMFYSACIQDLYELVKSRRADSIKEALNKYDDSRYKARMQEMQAAIQNATAVAAEESIKQTAINKKIARNTHQIARNTHEIDRNTRRFR